MNNVIFEVNDKRAEYVIFKNIKKFIDSEDNIKERVQCYNILQEVLMCFKIYSNSFLNAVETIIMYMHDYITNNRERSCEEYGGLKYADEAFILIGIEEKFEELKKNFFDKDALEKIKSIKEMNKEDAYKCSEIENIKKHYNDIIAITYFKNNEIIIDLINADEIKLKIEYDLFII
ncbi:MAG: hypothetical protein II309_02070 [Bacilli bacterium]|nr:hypothetical protein [Bacilli bacterium]